MIKANCTNSVGLPIADIERRIIAAFQGLLLAPDLEADFQREYHQAIALRNREIERETESRHNRLWDVDRAIENIVRTVEAGAATPALLARRAGPHASTGSRDPAPAAVGQDLQGTGGAPARNHSGRRSGRAAGPRGDPVMYHFNLCPMRCGTGTEMWSSRPMVTSAQSWHWGTVPRF
jgi:hypothetical protein